MKLFQTSIVLVLISAQIIFVSSGVLPKKFPRLCSKSAPHYEECRSTLFQRIKPYLVKGVPSLGLPSLDPLKVISISLSPTINDQISFSGIFENMETTGIPNAQLTKFEFDHKTLKGVFATKVPELNTKLDYNISAQVFGNNIKNAGSATSKLINLVSEVSVTLKKLKKSDKEYLAIDNLDIKAGLDDVIIVVKTNDPAYQSTIDEVLGIYDQDHQRIIKLLQPVIIDTVATLARQIIDNAFSRVPMDDVIQAE